MWARAAGKHSLLGKGNVRRVPTSPTFTGWLIAALCSTLQTAGSCPALPACPPSCLTTCRALVTSQQNGREQSEGRGQGNQKTSNTQSASSKQCGGCAGSGGAPPARQCGFGRKPSTAMLRVALGMRTTRPSSSLQATIWQPSRDLQGEARRLGAGPQLDGQRRDAQGLSTVWARERRPKGGISRKGWAVPAWCGTARRKSTAGRW